jgi:glycosyltransferase involved in cell wall biosynthesis
MRIMHMSRAAETLRWFLIPTMKAQQKKGHYVCICTSEEADPCIMRDKMTDVNLLRKAGFDVFTHDLKRSSNPFGILAAILRVRKILKANSIDVIICHGALGTIVGRIAAKLAKTPKIIYFSHGLMCVPHQSRLSWHMRFILEKFLGRFTDALLVMNDYDEQLCKNKNIIRDRNKVFRISGMGVDLNRFSVDTDCSTRESVFKELGFPINSKFVISVGRLIPKKGILIFVEAAIKICKDRDDVYFAIAGHGPLHQQLNNMIITEGLERRIKLLGWLQDVTRYVKASDIFTLPTYYDEGLPVSILEAMSCGKPCVVTKHRGCEDAVEDNISGILIPVKDSQSLSAALIKLIDNDELRLSMGRAARKRIEKVFELNKCTREIVEALEKAIA